MNPSKKSYSITEQINSVLKPKELTEEKEEVEAKFDDFDEFRSENKKIIISDIRKRNAIVLSELDKKYKGKVVSRKELQDEEDNDDDDDDDDDISDSEKNDSLDNSSESESSVEDDSNYGDFDLSQFSKNNIHNQLEKKQEEAELLIKKKSGNDNEVKKGKFVQNQLKIWENLLEVRIKAQKMLICANSFPDYDAFLEISTKNEPENVAFLERAESTCDNIYNLIDNLLDLQNVLVKK